MRIERAVKMQASFNRCSNRVLFLLLSYSSPDADFASRLYAHLQAQGVRCWFAAEDLSAGNRLYAQIDEAIRVSDKLILILLESSMRSGWVTVEVRNAIERERRLGKRVIFPISLAPFDSIRQWHAFDADLGQDIAATIREYYVLDFSNWKDHASYQAAFQRLLKDLRSD